MWNGQESPFHIKGVLLDILKKPGFAMFNIQLGIYKHAEKIILEDIKLYRVPEKIHLLVKTLVGIINY